MKSNNGCKLIDFLTLFTMLVLYQPFNLSGEQVYYKLITVICLSSLFV